MSLVRDDRLGSYSQVGALVRGGHWVQSACMLRLGLQNIGSLMGKSIELVKILRKRKII